MNSKLNAVVLYLCSFVADLPVSRTRFLQGVSNASAVVCFMSQKYQESENCTLEVSTSCVDPLRSFLKYRTSNILSTNTVQAKFAKQSGVEIIPGTHTTHIHVYIGLELRVAIVTVHCYLHHDHW
eukprot:SAG31_NODE_1409_length_8471_cov_12.764931_3_plen_125_part_00